MPDNPLTRTAPAAKPGIVHLGLGAFFRAHGAIYTQQAMAAAGGDWGIIGVSLKTPTTRDALLPQGSVYHALELAPDGAELLLVTSLNAVLVAPENPYAVLAAMADPAVKIVSLTVTEKGYCHHPASGALDRDHPDIIHDLTHDSPHSSIGYLTRALAMRKAAGIPPFTVLCCDNLPHNGRLLRGLVLEFAQALDPSLADWIAQNGAFPSTMVDRIVPATTEDTRAEVARLTGFSDAAPVVHEPYRQWVMEDDFVGGVRPAWDQVGAELVRDVAPFEDMKLKMLNASHSALSYLGYVAGHQTITAVMSDPVFDAYAQRLWQREIIPHLTPPEGVSLGDYAAALRARFKNPAIQHRTWQIAMDGSQKLPQRLLGTLRTARAKGAADGGLILAIAGWMRYVCGLDEAGAVIDLRDPMADALRAAHAGADGTEAVARILGLEAIFDPSLAADIRAPVTDAYLALARDGVRKTLEAYLAT